MKTKNLKTKLKTKLKKKLKKWLFGSGAFFTTMVSFGMGVHFSEPVKTAWLKFEKFNQSKAGVAVWAASGGALALPSVFYGIYLMSTTKRRKLKKLDIEKKKLEIKQLENKLNKKDSEEINEDIEENIED